MNIWNNSCNLFFCLSLSKLMELLRQHIKPGGVYRRSDLEYFSTAIDRHLSQLVQEGTLLRLSQGLYHAPQFSKFGAVSHCDDVLVECFLKDDEFLMASPNSSNSLGLGLTQLYNTTWVYNHKRKGEFRLNGKLFEFKLKSSFPTQLTKEFLLVELLNSMDYLAENPYGTPFLLLQRIPAWHRPHGHHGH
jgi:hypothetical protein